MMARRLLALCATFVTFPLLSGCLPTAAHLAPLRQCESHGNYRAVSRSGAYMGAYQFSQSTWDATARRVDPDWVGVRPHRAPAWEQDRMALALWDGGRGRGHWPVCGKRVR